HSYVDAARNYVSGVSTSPPSQPTNDQLSWALLDQHLASLGWVRVFPTSGGGNTAGFVTTEAANPPLDNTIPLDNIPTRNGPQTAQPGDVVLRFPDGG